MAMTCCRRELNFERDSNGALRVKLLQLAAYCARFKSQLAGISMNSNEVPVDKKVRDELARERLSEINKKFAGFYCATWQDLE